jgi:hypothetical protein
MEMFKINKKRFILISLIVLGLVVCFLFLKKKPKTTPSTPQMITPPEITNYFKEGLPIKVEVKSSEFNFPEKLPYLKQNTITPLTGEQSVLIATNLGFTKDPLKFTDVKNGEVNIWNSDNYSLMIYPKIRKIKLVPASDPREKIASAINKQFSDQEYLSLASDFFNQKISLDNSNISFSNYVYLKVESGLELYKETAKENAQITQLNFSQSSSKYPIMILNAQDSQIIIQFLRNGEVLNFEASLLTNLTSGEIEYRLKKYDEFTKTANESILVSLNDSNVNLPDLNSKSISEIIVSEVKLVYLLDKPNTDFFQPVFLLKGAATVQGFPDKVSALLYLPAFSKE